MNLVLLFKEDFISGTGRVHLGGRRLKHVAGVHHAKPGDHLRVGLENGLMGKGTVQSIGPEGLEMDVELATMPPAGLDLNLILALPRPKALSRILLSLSSLGVKKIWLIQAMRVEKSYWESPRLMPEKLQEQLIIGLEQAQDTCIPQVFLRKGFKPFVEDELPGIMNGTQSYVAHPGAGVPCPTAMTSPVTLVVGPEGGFIPYEVDKLIEIGCQPVHLGKRILRTETVLPFIIGRMFP